VKKVTSRRTPLRTELNDGWTHPLLPMSNKLTRDQVKAFRAKLIDTSVKRKGVESPRAKSTVNRDMTALRAALNHALVDGKVTTDFAWREALEHLSFFLIYIIIYNLINKNQIYKVFT